MVVYSNTLHTFATSQCNSLHVVLNYGYIQTTVLNIGNVIVAHDMVFNVKYVQPKCDDKNPRCHRPLPMSLITLLLNTWILQSHMHNAGLRLHGCWQNEDQLVHLLGQMQRVRHSVYKPITPAHPQRGRHRSRMRSVGHVSSLCKCHSRQL